jgi:hypothetical protein
MGFQPGDPLLRRCRTVVRCGRLPAEIAPSCLTASHGIQPCWCRFWVSEAAVQCRASAFRPRQSQDCHVGAASLVRLSAWARPTLLALLSSLLVGEPPAVGHCLADDRSPLPLSGGVGNAGRVTQRDTTCLTGSASTGTMRSASGWHLPRTTRMVSGTEGGNVGHEAPGIR